MEAEWVDERNFLQELSFIGGHLTDPGFRVDTECGAVWAKKLALDATGSQCSYGQERKSVKNEGIVKNLLVCHR